MSVMKSFQNEATPIVKYGMLLLFITLASIAFSDLRKINEQNREDVISKQSRLQALSELEGEDIWFSRVEESKELKNAMTSRLWQGETSGLISAKAQQSLTEILNNLGAKQILISIDPTIEEINGLKMLPYTITCNLPKSDAIIDLFLKISNHPNIIVLTEVQVTIPQRKGQLPRLEINGFIPTKITDDRSEG